MSADERESENRSQQEPINTVPSDDHLRPTHLLEHIQHLGLKHRVHSLDRHTGPRLGHGKHVHDLDRVVVHKLTEHQPHDLERHTRPAVLEHLQKGEGGDVDLLTRVLWSNYKASALEPASENARMGERDEDASSTEKSGRGRASQNTSENVSTNLLRGVPGRGGRSKSPSLL